MNPHHVKKSKELDDNNPNKNDRKDPKRLRAVGIKRAGTLVNKAEHSVGSHEAPEAARVELRLLLQDYEMYSQRMKDLMQAIEKS